MTVYLNIFCIKNWKFWIHIRCVCIKLNYCYDLLYRSIPIQGFLDDYVFLIRGLLDLYEASLDADWLQWAETLQETQDKLFWDEKDGGYFSSSAVDKTILLRGKEGNTFDICTYSAIYTWISDQDGAEPCGNSVSVNNLIRLANYLHRGDLREKAGRTLAAFSERLKSIPIALPEMTSALMLYHNFPTQVNITKLLWNKFYCITFRYL